MEAVAILILFPKYQSGIVVKEKSPMSIPKMPKGSAAPRECTHSTAKKVQAKEMMERRIVTMVKASAARAP